jgi:uncharacterized protein
VYRKYDGSLHWHQTMRRLGADDHGVWLGAAAGTVARKGDGPAVVVEHQQVMLVPDDAWWTAVFNAPPARMEIYCDIATPPRWAESGLVTMVDLDLDVCRMRADQHVRLLDEDEFAMHQVRYGYPADVIGQANDAAAWLCRALSDGAEPFASEYQWWLARLG